MTAWLYVIAWCGTLLDQLAGVSRGGLIAGAAILVFLLNELPRQRPALRLVFLGLTAAGLVGVALAPHPWAVLLAAWRRGAAYASFFLALGALREAAETSKLVRRCGRQLVSQPAGRRTAALLGGGHLFGIILSYGAIDLFGAMVARAEGAGGRASRQTRTMLMAAYRGFATMNCWSPLNIMTAVVSAAVPAADMRPLMPVAFLMAMGMLGVAWWEAQRGAAAEAPGVASGEKWSIHLRIVALVLLVMALAEAVSRGFAVSLSTGVTAAVPAIGFAWVAVQARRWRGVLSWRAWAVMLGRRLAGFYRRIPSFRGEAAVLGAGGFLGVALGAALPHGGIAPFLAGGALPPVLVPLLVPVVLLATGLLGLNPIAVVAVIGAAVPDPLALGVAPSVLAFACMLGWGVAVGMTPMSASAIATARWVDADPWTLAVRWNFRYTMGALALASAAIVVAHLVWSP